MKSIEKVHRVRCEAVSDLKHNEITYKGRLENISSKGALVSMLDGLIVPDGDECSCTVYLEGGFRPLQFTAKVIDTFYTMAALEFTSYDADTRQQLYKLVAAGSGSTN